MKVQSDEFMRTRRVPLACLALLFPALLYADGGATTPAIQPSVAAASDIDAGRYLVTIGGCHDCHTAMWAETNGGVPESESLTGTPMGWRGPWGTTYASNLRLLVQDMPEDAWVAMLRSRQARPPMPWMNTAKLSEADSRAMYRYIRSLGSAGVRMPTAVEPGSEPATPYLLMEPQQL